ncbi:hypothetical protein CWU_03575 [Buchnera aphidicola str. JF98 (Acyrthosiphon pisum)]|nr:hypothetical protein CWU_03575 [Buchnera aphidicola str. JF98 (Acyrthosiphon pisum)]
MHIFLKKSLKVKIFNPTQVNWEKKIYDQISKKAWEKWIEKQTILINEENLNMFNLEHRKKIEKYMKLFLFKK